MLIKRIKNKLGISNKAAALAAAGILVIAAILRPGDAGAAFSMSPPPEGEAEGFKASGQAKSYLLSVDYNKDVYSTQGVTLLDSKAPDYLGQPESGFRCDVISVNDEVLFSFRFGVPNIQCSDSFGLNSEGGCVTKESGQFSLAIPYYETGKLINIYDTNDKMVLSSDISDFAQLCGDNICEENENAGVCPSDCRSGVKDGICDRAKDGTCDPDCEKKQDVDCMAPASGGIYTVALIALLLVLAGLGGYLIWRKRNNSGGQEAEE